MFTQPIRKNYDASVGSTTLGDAGKGAALGSSFGPWGTVIGGVVGAGYGLVSGLIQKKKANNLLKNNPYPIESIPAEELANQQIAQNMALEGMPSAQYQQAQKNIQRQQAAALAAAQDRRVGTSVIGAIQQGTNDAQGALDAQSAAERRQNQLNLQNVNSRVGAYRQQAFDWNSKQKYLQNYQYGMSLLGAGNANVVSGADKLIGGLAGAYSNGLFSGRGGAGTGGGTTVSSSFGQPSYENSQYND